MRKFKLILLIVLCFTQFVYGQTDSDRNYSDSLVKANSIPGLNYAVFTKDSILSYGSFGLRNINKTEKLTFDDILPIGSCSKSVTGLIAAKLVSQGYIAWETNFFSLYPKLRTKQSKRYDKLTLKNLLSHRAEVPSLTGQNNEAMPKMKYLLDTTKLGRVKLAKWILNQKPVQLTKTYSYSNGGYVLAAIMMEKVTGKTWEQLVYEELSSQNIIPYFKFPNEIDTNYVWLHDERIYPVSPELNDEAGVRKPLAAGGLIFMSFPDAVKYVQLNMKGNSGESSYLNKEQFQSIHSGFPEYSIGWGNRDINGTQNILHRGNIGGRSWCLFQFIPLKNIGVVIMTNSGDQQSGVVINQIRDFLISKFTDKN